MKRIVTVATFLMMILGIGRIANAAVPAATPTFAKDVAPILYSKCVKCHRPGEVAPMSLIGYNNARPWAKAIKQKVVSREMPPWFADRTIGKWSNDPSLTQQQIDTLLRGRTAGRRRATMRTSRPCRSSRRDGPSGPSQTRSSRCRSTPDPCRGRNRTPTTGCRIRSRRTSSGSRSRFRPGNLEVVHHADAEHHAGPATAAGSSRMVSSSLPDGSLSPNRRETCAAKQGIVTG